MEMPLVPEDVCVERIRAFHSIHLWKPAEAVPQWPKASPPQNFPNGSAKVMSHGKKEWSSHRTMIQWQQTAVQIGCIELILEGQFACTKTFQKAARIRAPCWCCPHFSGKSPPQHLQHSRVRKVRIVMIHKIKTENWTRKKVWWQTVVVPFWDPHQYSFHLLNF